jgi:hypothetical protein
MARVYQSALRCETHAHAQSVPRGSAHCPISFGMPRNAAAFQRPIC